MVVRYGNIGTRAETSTEATETSAKGPKHQQEATRNIGKDKS